MDLVAKIVLWISKIYNDRVYPYDLEEPLKLPEEFIEAVEEPIRSRLAFILCSRFNEWPDHIFPFFQKTL